MSGFLQYARAIKNLGSRSSAATKLGHKIARLVSIDLGPKATEALLVFKFIYQDEILRGRPS